MVAPNARRPITTYDVLRGLAPSTNIRLARISYHSERARILKQWQEIKRRPPAERRQWLKTQEAIGALGAEVCRLAIEAIDDGRLKIERELAAGAWIEAWLDEGIEPPNRDADHQGGQFNWRGVWRPSAKYSTNDAIRYRGLHYAARCSSHAISPEPGKITDHWKPTAARQYAARMILGRGFVRFGDEGRPTRRWTPPHAVNTEDMLDLLSDKKATFHRHPPSPSAMAIFRVVTYGKKIAERMAHDRPRRNSQW